jgi:hypothetical protein
MGSNWRSGSLDDLKDEYSRGTRRSTKCLTQQNPFSRSETCGAILSIEQGQGWE